MSRETQRGYLSSILQRGARTVRALDQDRRASLRPNQNRVSVVSPVVPLEIETFSNSPRSESHVLDMKQMPSGEIQSNAANPSLQSGDTPIAVQKPDAGHAEFDSQTRSIETNPSLPNPARSVRNDFPNEPLPAEQIIRAVTESSQISAVAGQAIVKASTVDRHGQVIQPTTRPNEASNVLGGAIESLGEKKHEDNSNWTEPSESKGPPSFRIRDGYVRAREIPGEETNFSASFEASAVTHAAESNTPVKSQSGLSHRQVPDQFSAGTSQQTTSALPRVIAESFPPRKDSPSVGATTRETPAKKDATSPESTFRPRAENLRNIVQPLSVPRFAEAGASQRATSANSISPDASPKLTINRLDIQIIDQTPQPTIIAPMPLVARPDEAESIDRYQLGHIHLIF